MAQPAPGAPPGPPPPPKPVNHVVLYKFWPNTDAIGRMDKLNQTDTYSIVTGQDVMGIPPGVSPHHAPAAGAPRVTYPAGNPKIGWKQLGIFGNTHIVGARGPVGDAPVAPPKEDAKDAKFTEFVILFVWHESLPTAAPTPAAPPGQPKK